MPDDQVIAVIAAVGLASYAMRSGGYLLANVMPQAGLLPPLLRLAPGNLFVAFAAAGVLEGGLPSLAGCVGAITTMVVTRREWAALAGGFGAAAMAAALG